MVSFCPVIYTIEIWNGWVHTKCSGILNAAQYRRKSDWTCDACSAPQSQQLPPPTRSPAPPTKQISDDSTFNANGIGNKLTELEVVLERNNVKVAVIQESKLSPKSKNPCIQNYTTVRKDGSRSKAPWSKVRLVKSPNKQTSKFQNKFIGYLHM